MAGANLSEYRRILLLTDGHSTPFLAKTAISLLRYRPHDVVGLLDRELSGKTTDEVFGVGGSLPVVDGIGHLNADSLFVGIAPPGGRLPEHWRPMILEALNSGMDVVSGLHHFLNDDVEFVAAASKHGRKLIDVRQNDESEVATCANFRSDCFRIHAVGNDCSLGKMTTCLEVQRAMLSAGYDAGFAATGQTGIMVQGTGIPIDCVVADFVNGAAERLVLQNQEHEFLFIEGQGSISHPMYSGVTLGLLHGCAPDALFFCYEAGREYVKGLDSRKLPPLEQVVAACEMMANLRHPCKVIGFAANTRNLDDADALQQMQQIEDRFQLPVVDVFRNGPERLVQAILSSRSEMISK